MCGSSKPSLVLGLARLSGAKRWDVRDESWVESGVPKCAPQEYRDGDGGESAPTGGYS